MHTPVLTLKVQQMACEQGQPMEAILTALHTAIVYKPRLLELFVVAEMCAYWWKTYM